MDFGPLETSVQFNSGSFLGKMPKKMWSDFEILLEDKQCEQEMGYPHTTTVCKCDTTTLDEDFPKLTFGLGKAKFEMMPS